MISRNRGKHFFQHRQNKLNQVGQSTIFSGQPADYYQILSTITGSGDTMTTIAKALTSLGIDEWVIRGTHRVQSYV